MREKQGKGEFYDGVIKVGGAGKIYARDVSWSVGRSVGVPLTPGGDRSRCGGGGGGGRERSGNIKGAREGRKEGRKSISEWGVARRAGGRRREEDGGVTCSPCDDEQTTTY